MPQRRHHINPPLNIYRKLALSFIVITAVLIGAIFYFTLSYAYITVYPSNQNINSDFNFIVVEDAQSAKPDQGILLGKIIDQTVNAEKVFSATGSKTLAGDTVGRVELFNNQNRPQILVATTRLLTADNLLFRLKSRVIIPAMGQIETLAYPDDPAKPLVAAGTKFTIPGLNSSLQQLVYAQAVEDFKAAGSTVKVVSKDDLSKALSSYTDELAQQAVLGIASDQQVVLKKDVVSQVFGNKEGDQVDEFKLNLAVHVSGAVFDPKEAAAYAHKILLQLITPDQELVSDNSDKLNFDLEKIDTANHLAQLKGNVQGIAVISPNSQVFNREKIKSMSESELKDYLAGFSQIQKSEISYFPGWQRQMPFFADHIIIKINR